MTIAQKRIIHRFVQPISKYEEGGEYFYQVIPTDTQVFAQYPEGRREVELYFVIGDGKHTYVELREGLGTLDYAKEYPIISTDELKGLLKSSTDPEIIYGTDADGNQYCYPLADVRSISLLLTNIEIDPTRWVLRQFEESDFKYEYVYEYADINDRMIPYVTFDEREASSGVLSPVCRSENGELILYSRKPIEYTFKIPNIIFFYSVSSNEIIEEISEILKEINGE